MTSTTHSQLISVYCAHHMLDRVYHKLAIVGARGLKCSMDIFGVRRFCAARVFSAFTGYIIVWCCRMSSGSHLEFVHCAAVWWPGRRFICTTTSLAFDWCALSVATKFGCGCVFSASTSLDSHGLAAYSSRSPSPFDDIIVVIIARRTLMHSLTNVSRALFLLGLSTRFT